MMVTEVPWCCEYVWRGSSVEVMMMAVKGVGICVVEVITYDTNNDDDGDDDDDEDNNNVDGSCFHR